MNVHREKVKKKDLHNENHKILTDMYLLNVQQFKKSYSKRNKNDMFNCRFLPYSYANHPLFIY
jgi:hypothetical protein